MNNNNMHRASFRNAAKSLINILIILVLIYPFLGGVSVARGADQTTFKAFLPLIANSSAAGNAPVINSFTATPAIITAGASSTLAWSVSSATSLSISPDVGTVTGTSVSVSPTATTEYTLTASNIYGSATAKITVTVQAAGNAPVINSFTATPAIITAGASSTLAWSVSGATSLSISPDVGTVTGTSVSVNPTATTEYTLTASNIYGSMNANVIVTVQQPTNPSGFFIPGIGDIDRPTSRPTVVVDSANGVHVGFAPDTNTDEDPTRSAYYAYCPGNCTSASAFTITHLYDHVVYVNLALDPSDRPRMMLTVQVAGNNPQYVYAECNSNCTLPAQWSFMNLTYFFYHASWGMQYSHGFALDNLGRPRFLYVDVSEFQGGGVFYAFCDNACTNLNNWYDVHISLDKYAWDIGLTLSPTGMPRLIWQTFDDNGNFIVYWECNLDCSAGENWHGTRLLNTINSSVAEYGTYSLTTDSEGRPHLAFYAGTGVGGDLPPNRMYYLMCAESDCTQLQNWYYLDLGLQHMHGEEGVSLALDAQNRPRIAYHAPLTEGHGLYYAWCDFGCLTSSQNWQFQEIEPSEQVDQELPIPPAPGCSFPVCNPPVPACTVSFWNNGVRPSLDLDSAGNPYVAYDADHEQGGGCPSHTDTRLTRFIFFSQP